MSNISDVTQSDRDAFRSICLRGDSGPNIRQMLNSGAWDSDSRMQELIRFRQAHSLSGDALRLAKTLLLAIDGIEAHCRNDAGLKGEDHAADGRRVRHAMNLLAEEARQQLAALTIAQERPS